MKKKDAYRVFLGWRFRLYLLTQLPIGLLVGLSIREIGDKRCCTTVPYKWLNKNPFRSMYFAVQAMAAEMSTAAPCLHAVLSQKRSIAFIIVGCKAKFHKKATSLVTFSCEFKDDILKTIEKCLESGESASIALKTIGTQKKDHEVVSEFEFTWSFKERKPQS